MTSARTKKRLAKLGFEYDEDVTGKDPSWDWWNGTIDPIGRMRIAGDNACMGHAVSGATRAEMDDEAIAYAMEFSGQLVACPDADCEFHGPTKSGAN